MREAHRIVHEELIALAAPVANEVRERLDTAVRRGDAEAIRTEGHHWSGRIGLVILRLADELESHLAQKG